MTVSPRAVFRRKIASSMFWVEIGSNALVGSSSNSTWVIGEAHLWPKYRNDEKLLFITSGSLASVRARATRWAWPTESSDPFLEAMDGGRSARPSSLPTSSSESFLPASVGP